MTYRAAYPITVPLGKTARRLEWVHLPPVIRGAVEKRLGSPVVDAVSKTSGYTPGFASVLTCADGSSHFVKAASVKAQRTSATMYREEARKLPIVPPDVPAPRLQWVYDEDDWVVLGIEYIDGTAPARPWQQDQFDAASDMLVAMAASLTPAPGIGIGTLADDFADVQAPQHPDLARHALDVLSGDTLVHGDVRDDNLIVRPDGRVSLCDWNWPRRGPAWFDSLTLLIGPRGDGLDVEAHIARHPLLSEVPADDINAVLALFVGYFLGHADQPAPPAMPWVREIQRWQGEVCRDWLAERTG